jgi:hypothetical protein
MSTSVSHGKLKWMFFDVSMCEFSIGCLYEYMYDKFSTRDLVLSSLVTKPLLYLPKMTLKI